MENKDSNNACQQLDKLKINNVVKTNFGQKTKLISNNGENKDAPYVFIITDNDSDCIRCFDINGNYNGTDHTYYIINTHLNVNTDYKDIFNKLLEAKTEDEAYEIAKPLIGRCFSYKNNKGKSGFKIYDIEKQTGYLTTISTRFYSYTGCVAFDYNKKYVFECKDKSERILWRRGTYSPKTKKEDYAELVEISEDEYNDFVRAKFEEYYNNEILCNNN